MGIGAVGNGIGYYGYGSAVGNGKGRSSDDAVFDLSIEKNRLISITLDIRQIQTSKLFQAFQ